MPAIIVFGAGAPGASGEKGNRGQSLRVADDAETVTRKLDESSSGFASFQSGGGKSSRTVWVNKAQVWMVREVGGRS